MAQNNAKLNLKVIRSFMSSELVLQVASCKKNRADLISIWVYIRSYELVLQIHELTLIYELP